MIWPVGLHSPRVCKRISNSIDYHTKSYSYRFECSCGKSRRYNTNFLGNRFDLVCDGKMIRRVRRGEAVEYTVVTGIERGAVETTVTDYPECAAAHPERR